MSKSTIVYKDIAPGAAEDAIFTSLDATEESNLSLLADGSDVPRIATCELNYWILDGTAEIIDNQSLAFWSAQLSGEDCTFTDAPVITMAFTNQYSSVGVSLVFDNATGEYCSSINIKWYQGDTLKSDKDFAPSSSSFFCANTVTSFDKIVITINKTSLPYRYAKICQILIGLVRTFDMTELRSVKIMSEINPVSLELPMSAMDWTLDSKEDVELMFQTKQPVEVYNDDILIGVYYIDSAKRSAETIYTLTCSDALGVLDDSQFSGNVYNNYSAKQLVQDVINGDFNISFEVEDTNLTGAILPCTRREALQQILFAWGVCASTDEYNGIRIFTLDTTATVIDANRTYMGTTSEIASLVTAVQITAHTYTQNTAGNVEINGTKYTDTQTVYTVTNPNVTANDKQNIISIDSATLISPSIGQSTAQRIYDYYQWRSTNTAKIVWRGEKLGDCITTPNIWGTTSTGNISKMEIMLSNTVAATCTTIGA